MLKNVLTLAGGAGVSQVLPFLLTPILTRLYEPEQFGVLGVFVAISSIFSIVITGRYEVEIINSDNDDEAKALLSITILLSVGFSIIISILFMLFCFIWDGVFEEYITNGYLYLIPISSTLIALNTSTSTYLSRLEKYKAIATSRVVTVWVTTVCQIIFGSFILMESGLVVSTVVGHAIGSAIVIWCAIENLCMGNCKNKLYDTAVKYANCPKYLIAGQLLSTTSLQLPVIVFEQLYGKVFSGSYVLAQRMLLTPVSIVTNAIGEVFRNQFSDRFNKGESIASLYWVFMVSLAIVATAICLPFAVSGPALFEIFLGEQWSGAGRMSQILALLIGLQAIVSPLSHIILILGKHNWELYWQIFRFLSMLFAIYIGFNLDINEYYSLGVFVVLMTVCYVVHLTMQIIILGTNR